MTQPAGSSNHEGARVPVSAQRPAPFFEEPSSAALQKLLDTFLPHSFQFGFFLDITSFRAATLLPLPLGRHQRPTPALVAAVVLWGAHLFRSDPYTSQEHTFLIRALRYAATDMSGDHPRKIIHTLQAEILLSYYFLRIGRFLDAKIHATTAVTIALECGLNKIHSSSGNSFPALGIVQDHPVALQFPIDKHEEGERINGFWSAFALHKLITVMLQPSHNLCGILETPTFQVDTPWPLDIEAYQQEGFDPKLTTSSTLINFLNNNYTSSFEGQSTTAQYTKAVFLFHRSAFLASRYSPTLSPHDYHSFTTASTMVHQSINNLRSQLPQLSHLDLSKPSTRTMLLTHVLVDAATIKLHTPFAYSSESSKQLCLRSAQNIITFGGVNLQEVGYLNPVMGYLWMMACQVLIDEISRIRHSRNFYGSGELGSNEEHFMEEWYRVGLAALNCFTDDNPLTRYHMSKTQEAFNAI